MSILTEIDRAIYFPDVPLQGEALDGLIQRAQMLAEGPQGANRPLEITPFKEIVRMNVSLQTARLTFAPLALTPAPVVEARRKTHRDNFGRVHPTTAWVTLTEGEGYIIDEESGEIHLSLDSQLGFGRSVFFTELRVTYTSGFDTTQDTYEVRQLKAAVGSILNWLGTHSNERYMLRDEVTGVTFSESRKDLPIDYLLPLRKYCPRI